MEIDRPNGDLVIRSTSSVLKSFSVAWGVIGLFILLHVIFSSPSSSASDELIGFMIVTALSAFYGWFHQ